MSRAVVRSPFARTGPSSSTHEVVYTEAESCPKCRANFCQEESRENSKIFRPPRSFGGLIHSLKPLDRQVVLLYLEGLDAASIGEVTGSSPGSIATKFIV